MYPTWLPFSLQAGDAGVRSVETVTLGTTTSMSGVNVDLVTPAMAEAILQRNQPSAQASWPMRPIRRADLSMWANRLRAGRFRYTHQGVALDADGRLQDGQHRLTAIAETGIAGEMMVSAGWPGDNYTVHDTGRRRTAGQALHHQGAANANTTASAVRLIHLYEVWDAAMLV